LSSLGYLSLTANQLSGSIPAELGNLSSLGGLWLYSNQLSGSIPVELGKLALLQELDLSSNRLTGDIPDSFVNLVDLSGLDLDYNYLKVPVDYPDPSNPLHVFLSEKDPDWHLRQYFNCGNVSEIPQQECEALVALYESTNGAGWYDHTNWLVTNTPSTWHGVTVESGHVTVLYLELNGLSGSIPAELGNLSFLSSFSLNENQLSGSIPVALGNLSSLHRLDLSNNQLSGVIPSQLGYLSSLVYLYLDDNQLSGPIPPELSNLSGLWELSLFNNRLTGSIPKELGNLSSLQFLYLEDNQLNGPIPVELANLNSLEGLFLNNNQLSGSLPPELANLINLVWLSVSNNQLNGVIPPELGNMSSLHLLDLSSNQLSGTIPLELSNLSSLTQLVLSNNLLSGSIPAELGNMIRLWFLSLSDNQLSGTIPSELGNLKGLWVLRLNNNQLAGNIPDTFIDLIDLYDPGTFWDGGDGLDLDYNALNVPTGYPDPSVPLQVFLSQKDPDWHTLQAFTQVIGTSGGTLTSLDGRTTFDIPAGALITDTTFTFTPQPVPNHSPARLSDAHNSFQLSAVDAVGDPVTAFNLPVTVTLGYTDTDIPSIFEDTLGLYYWDSLWVDALSTCSEGEYTRDLDANTFSLPICHLSEFAVLGQSLQFFIPLVQVQR
jgi:Leucine-rich repeat (LRR) protein